MIKKILLSLLLLSFVSSFSSASKVHQKTSLRKKRSGVKKTLKSQSTVPTRSLKQKQKLDTQLRNQKEAQIAQERVFEEKLRQQEQARIRQEVREAQQRQKQAEAKLTQQKQRESLASQQKLDAKLTEIGRNIHPNNLKSYQDMGLTDLFMNGFFGQNTTVAVIEGGFYHTLDPHYRPILGDIQIPGLLNDWYSHHKEQILPPLSFYNPILSPVDQRFEANLKRGKPFRFDHGDRVLSIIAEASPHARILPVQASFGRMDNSFVRALEALSQRDDVNIINMSRWLESCAHDETQLNPDVLTALRKCTDSGKIIVLAACNTPNPIPLHPSSSNDVQDIGNFAANLISDLFSKMIPDDSLRKHVVISGALDNETNTISYYSVRAGYGAARQNYIATNGSSYSQIKGSYWNGTSASAPHTSAVLANLMSIRPGVQPSKIVEALFKNADFQPYNQNIYGSGLLNGKRSFHAIKEDM